MTAGANKWVDWTRTGDAEVRRRLENELERLRTCDVFAALGLRHEADDQQVRAAFLTITKTYHPNRFARRDPEIFRLANEVFLRMKEAYARLSTTSLREREVGLLGVGVLARPRNEPTMEIPVAADGSLQEPRAAGPEASAPEQNGITPRAEPAAPPAARPRPSRAPGTNPSRMSRAPGTPPFGVPRTPGTPPFGVPRTPGTNPSRMSRAPGTNPSRMSRAPGTNPSRIPRTPGTPPRGVPRTPGTPPRGIPRAPGTNPSQPTQPVELDLRRVTANARRMRRSGGSTHPSATPAKRPTDWTKEFRAAKAKLDTGAYAAAREEFKQLAVQDPSNKEFRVYMHYASGREHQAAGRADRARAEYNRALALDADFAPARAALESLDGPRPRGLLSKWFKK